MFPAVDHALASHTEKEFQQLIIVYFQWQFITQRYKVEVYVDNRVDVMRLFCVKITSLPRRIPPYNATGNVGKGRQYQIITL